MAFEGISWIYLAFFLIIPLSRIIPKVIQKWKGKKEKESINLSQQTYQSTNELIDELSQKASRVDIPKDMKPPSLQMLVLGELNRGTKNFDAIQKNLGIDSKTLDKTLQNLEEQGMMEVQNKQGLFGPKIELILTDKGFKRFYSKDDIV